MMSWMALLKSSLLALLLVLTLALLSRLWLALMRIAGKRLLMKKCSHYWAMAHGKSSICLLERKLLALDGYSRSSTTQMAL